MDIRSIVRRKKNGNGKANGKKRVLLANAYGPYRLKWGACPSDLLGARLARDNNMDGKALLYAWALYIIAENISNPCTVLECPTWEEFLAEVDKGYDVIALQLISMYTDKTVDMMRAIRERSPQTEIVVGGYGVGMLQQPLPGDKAGHAEYIKANADHLCRAEGVRFMRELLNDAPFDRPITQYHVPPAQVQVDDMNVVKVSLPAILVSLGCPNACEFCNTSAFFYHKKIEVASPAQVYDFMKAHQRRLGAEALTFILFDEDLFLDREWVLELGRLIRSDKKTWGFRWITFGSMRALSNFTPMELRECGAEGIWIGVESGIMEEDKSKTGYGKRDGTMSPPEMFAELHRHGIQTIGSTIIGFDFHTPENIEQDIDYFVSLNPTLYQISPFRPCPGTRFYDRMLAEERINDCYDWEDIHLWEEGSFKLKHLKEGDVKKYFDLAHEKLRSVNGPPLLQIFECALLGYETLKDSDSEYLQYQAELSKTRVMRISAIVRSIALYTRYPLVKQRAEALLERAAPILDIGPVSARKVIRWIAPRAATRIGVLGTYGPGMASGKRRGTFVPESRCTEYNVPGKKGPVTRWVRDGGAEVPGQFRFEWRRMLPRAASRTTGW